MKPHCSEEHFRSRYNQQASPRGTCLGRLPLVQVQLSRLVRVYQVCECNQGHAQLCACVSTCRDVMVCIFAAIQQSSPGGETEVEKGEK